MFLATAKFVGVKIKVFEKACSLKNGDVIHGCSAIVWDQETTPRQKRLFKKYLSQIHDLIVYKHI